MRSIAKPMLWLSLLFATATPALAHDSTGASDNDIDIGGDRITIGTGLAVTPSYIGSDSTIALPTLAIQGQVSGLSFNSQGTAFYLDAIPDNGKPGWKLQLGPLAALRLDRNSMIDDSAVAALGKRRKALELGGWAGIQRTGVVTSPYDTLSFGLSYQHDVNRAHRSDIVSPSIDYATPLSHTAYASFSLSADHVGRGFGRYYYDVDPAGSAASGLPVYSRADKAGWKDWNGSMLLAHSLTGNLTHGLSVFATGGYARMLGAYRRSPIVDMAGNPNQWSGAVGLAYTF